MIVYRRDDDQCALCPDFFRIKNKYEVLNENKLANPLLLQSRKQSYLMMMGGLIKPVDVGETL